MGASSIPAAFGEVLRISRRRAKLSQMELALRADVDRTYVSLLERGLRQPTLETLFRLAAVLNVPPARLVAKTTARLNRLVTSV